MVVWVAQGTLLKRQKVYHDGSNRAVTPLDLKIGASVQIFGHAYHIIDADGHVRRCATTPRALASPVAALLCDTDTDPRMRRR